MLRLITAGLILFAGVAIAPAQDKEPAKETAKQTEASPAKQAVLDNPDDVKALRGYLIGQLQELNSLSKTNPEKAEKQLKEAKAFLETLEPKDEAAKRLLSSGKQAFNSMQQQIVVAKLSLDDITAKLKKNPDDAEAVQNYGRKLAMTISPIARKDPKKAEKLMKDGQELLNSLSEKAEKEATKNAIKASLQLLGRFEDTIAGAKKKLALIGTPAAKLQVDAWVNGKPLTDEDLKGKVVLLDFWAVWCGPCIATFPHLREWDKKYDDLVIIGVTNYYDYTWDEEANQPKRGEEVSEEVEQDMLVQFAKHHELTHRFALQTDRKLSNHYEVTGIPQAVVIDRTGTVRLIRVGSGEENAKEIEQTIEKLIEE